MKFTVVLFLFLNSFAEAQVQLDSVDLKNLVQISERYSEIFVGNGENFGNAIDSFRTTRLDRLVTTLSLCSETDTSLLSPRILQRPANDELMLWYVIRKFITTSHLKMGNQMSRSRK